jgi:hypothetical protein
MIGGGVITPDIRDYVRADFQTIDAMEGVPQTTLPCVSNR